eukprot:2114285-Rhodomonas_salina.1
MPSMPSIVHEPADPSSKIASSSKRESFIISERKPSSDSARERHRHHSTRHRHASETCQRNTPCHHHHAYSLYVRSRDPQTASLRRASTQLTIRAPGLLDGSPAALACDPSVLRRRCWRGRELREACDKTVALEHPRMHSDRAH